jgi:allophanate hydrolase subunit 2
MLPAAGRRWPAGGFDPTDPRAPVRLVQVLDAPGVHPDVFEALIGRPWTVSPVGDRTGIRLDGEPLPTSGAAAALVSFGLLPGAIQLPASGEPIVLLADAPTIGGYPVPAVVARADQPILAQRPAGERLLFRSVDARTARSAQADLRAVLATGAGDPRLPDPP